VTGRFDPDRGGMSRGQGAVEQRDVLAGRTGPGVMDCRGNLLRVLMVPFQHCGAVRSVPAHPVVALFMPV